MQKERFYYLMENFEVLDEETADELQNVVNEFPYFQTALILHLKNLKKIDSPEYENTLKKVAVKISDRKKLYHFLNSGENVKQNKKQIHIQNESASAFQLKYDDDFTGGNSLIDKFLSSNAAIITPKPSENEAIQSSENEVIKKSVEENDEIITETLAMIYFQQKKYDKALDAFRKLSLKYPEKSIYFATRIEEIEKLKNI